MRYLFPYIVLAVFSFPGALSLWSAEDGVNPLAVEREEAAREEAKLKAEGKLPEIGHETILRGKYLSTPNREDKRSDIPGVFLVEGRAYKVKLQANDLLEKLKPFNGKHVTLGGKIRNRGQYFIVEEVLTQPGGLFVPAQAHTAAGRL